MKLLSKLLFITISIIALVLIVALFVDRDFTVERKVTIQQPAEEVFVYLKNLKNQNEWSVWQQMDPNMSQSFKGKDGQVGFVSAWKSNNEDVGEGEQEITYLHYPNRIETQIRFKKPFEANNKSYYDIQTVKNNTEVTWGITGSTPWPMNIMYLFVNMEDEIAPDFEKGLENLKKQLEGA